MRRGALAAVALAVPALLVAGCRSAPCCARVRCTKPPAQTAPPARSVVREAPHVVVELAGGGHFVARWSQDGGTRQVEGDLAGDPQAATAALEQLRAGLAALSEGWRDEEGSSLVTVEIRGDRAVRWAHVQWLMQAMADPTVRIFKMRFVTSTASG